MGLKRAATRGALWSFLERAGDGVVSLAIFLVLARMLGPDAFGVVALALVYVAFLRAFSEQGIGAAIVQRKELEREHLDAAFWAAVGIGMLMTGLGMLAARPLANVLHEPDAEGAIRWLSLTFAITPFSQVQEAVLRRRLAFRKLAIRSVIARAAGGAVGIPLAVAGFGAWSLVGMHLVQAAASALTLWFIGSWRPTRSFSWSHYVELLRFGIHIVGLNLLSFVNRRADNLIVGVYLGSVALGFYTIAYRVLESVTSLMTSTVAKVALPVFSRMQDQPERLRSGYYTATRLGSFFSFPVFMGIAAVAPVLVPVVFGAQWTGSIRVLQILCFIGALHGVAYFNSMLLTATGRPSWTFRITLCGAVANVILFLVFVRYGIEAVALAYVVRGYLFSPIALLVVRKVIAISLAEYYRPLSRIFIASLGMAACVALARLQLAPHLSGGALLVVCAVAGVLIYVSTMLLLDRRTVHEVVGLARRIRRTGDVLPSRALEAEPDALTPGSV